MPCSLVKWKKRSDYTYCTYIIAFSVIAKVWLLVAVATARKLLVCAKGGNFRIWIFVYWMRKFHRILLPFTSLVVGRYVASKLNVKKIIVEFQSSYFLMPYVISYQRQSLIVRICKVTSTHKKKCPQINFRLIFSIILWIKKLFEILPTLTITVFKKIDHCIKLFRKKQLKCDNLTTLYRDMYFIVCNTFSSE